METALITGASRGIGREIAKVFAEKGYFVIINYNNNEKKAAELKNELIGCGYAAEIIKADVSDEKQVIEMFSTIMSKHKKLDVLINNAGICFDKMLIDTTSKEWDKLFAVNVKGAFMCSKQALFSMMPLGKGSIINISSVCGEYGCSCEVAYSASKAAISGMTKALAKEVGLSGVRVNAVAPGYIETDMNNKYTLEDKNDVINKTPLQKLGNARQVAKAVLFLASEESSFITGQVLGVDGGFIP